MMPLAYLIGIGGPSCSGKTLLAARLADFLSPSKPVVLSLDSYYWDLSHLPLRERALSNFDSPDALDWPLFTAHVELLAQGRPIEKPVYDFATHTRPPQQWERVPPAPVVIVEGLFALYNEHVRAYYDLKVFVEASDATCLARRLVRDVRERGRAVESVHAQYDASVRVMAERFVLPTRAYADLIVSGEQPVEPAAARILTHIKGRACIPCRPRRTCTESCSDT